jgi:formyl-CoA transferase
VLAAIGRLDLKDDPRFIDADARQTPESQAEFIGLFLEWTTQRTMLEAWTELQAHEIPSGPVYTAREILDDPHFAERGLWDTLEVGAEQVRVPRDMPWDGMAPRPVQRAPRLGEHNQQIFAGELGLDPGLLAGLAAEGVV